MTGRKKLEAKTRERNGERVVVIACLAEARRGGSNTSMLCARHVDGEGTESEEVVLNRFYVRDSEREGEEEATTFDSTPG